MIHSYVYVAFFVQALDACNLYINVIVDYRVVYGVPNLKRWKDISPAQLTVNIFT